MAYFHMPPSAASCTMYVEQNEVKDHPAIRLLYTVLVEQWTKTFK
jgi:hypothetical protein